MRYAAKVDTTHAAIRDALRECGCLVHDCARYSGFVDLVVLKRGTWVPHLVEVKTPRGKTQRIKKTDSQRGLEADGWPIVFLKSVDEAVKWATE